MKPGSTVTPSEDATTLAPDAVVWSGVEAVLSSTILDDVRLADDNTYGL